MQWVAANDSNIKKLLTIQLAWREAKGCRTSEAFIWMPSRLPRAEFLRPPWIPCPPCRPPPPPPSGGLVEFPSWLPGVKADGWCSPSSLLHSGGGLFKEQVHILIISFLRCLWANWGLSIFNAGHEMWNVKSARDLFTEYTLESDCEICTLLIQL